MPSPQRLKQFYRDKSIFITGATGFIGKVLIEKLLRSCEDVGHIYVLLRKREGKSAQDRLDELMSSKVFTFGDKCLKTDKVIAIAGDISAPGLGISNEDRQTLIENVNIVFHSAASVKFHGPLCEFISQNVYGTQSVVLLCKEMTKLESVVYVSTAYANCTLEEVQEKIYPLSKSAKDIIKKISCFQDSTLSEALTNELLEGRPNCYTFSKALAENLVDEIADDLPLTIVRPSIVTPAMKEPAEGWVDNLNGVAGTLLLGSLGIARTMEVNCDIRADLIPVDVVCNALLVIAWHSSTFKNERKKVIHVTSGTLNPVTWGRFLDYSREAASKAPSIKMVRPLAKNPTSAKGKLGRLNHNLTKFISHVIFAYFVDMILVLLGYKKLMVNVTYKMHRAFSVLEHFTNKEWSFYNENFQEVREKLGSEDKKEFFCDIQGFNWRRYAESLYMGTRRYLLKEEDNNILQARKRLKVLQVGYLAFQVVLIVSIWYLIVSPFIGFVSPLSILRL